MPAETFPLSPPANYPKRSPARQSRSLSGVSLQSLEGMLFHAMLQWRKEAASRSCSAHLAITSHFWFFDKNLALKELFPYSYLLMKHRFLICILITLGGTAAYAQDQATTNAPSLFSPAPAAVPPSNTPAPVDASTSSINAPVPTTVDPLAPAAIAAAVERLRESPQQAQAMGRAGRQAVLERYNWPQAERDLLAFCRTVLA